MTLTQNQEFSLYKIAEKFEPKPSSLEMSLENLDQLVTSFFDVLIERNLGVTIWAKPIHDQIWISLLKNYQQKVRSKSIYWCSSTLPQGLINTVNLEIDSRLKQEYFLLFISSQFWGLIIVKASAQQEGIWKVICTFESKIIKLILTAIQTLIKPSNSALENLSSYLNNLSWNQNLLDYNVLSSLLLKQVNFSPVTNHTSETPNLKSEQIFLKKIVEEFRVSLTRIKTVISLLNSRKVKPDLQKYLDILSQECQQQNYLIKGLLELIEIEEFNLDQPMTKSDLGETITEIFSSYQPLIREKNITFTANIPPDLPAVNCPKNWLKQIIIHLVNNSLKFTQLQGNISLEAFPKSHYIILIFRDDGMGIPRQEIGKIFDCFYRGKFPISQNIPGAGLGLTIVQQLLTRCGGSISVVSKVKQGTIFRVKLPMIYD